MCFHRGSRRSLCRTNYHCNLQLSASAQRAHTACIFCGRGCAVAAPSLWAATADWHPVGQRTDRNLHAARGLNDFVKYTYGRRFFCARQQLRTPAGADATAAAHDQSSRTHADRARVCATDAQPGRGRRQSRTSSLWRVGYFRHTHTLWSSRSAVSSSFRGVA